MKHYFKEGYLQDRFKNIPFKEIDEMMWDIVGAFNIIGMKTIFCCQGHKSYEYPYVIFDENISDKEIENIAYILLTCDSYKGSFNKWVRKDGNKISSNWIWKLNYNNDQLFERDTETELISIVDILYNIRNKLAITQRRNCDSI